MKSSYFKILSVLFIFAIIAMIFNIIQEKYKYFNIVKNSKYMAHALSGIDGINYTNSKEALENSYNNGYRLFETDINFTKDHELVCVHGWKKSDYENKLGITYNSEGALSYYEFMNVKVKNKYTTISFKDLVELMYKYNDTYFLLDIGNKSYDETKEIYEEILNITQDKKILDRLITGRTYN